MNKSTIVILEEIIEKSFIEGAEWAFKKNTTSEKALEELKKRLINYEKE